MESSAPRTLALQKKKEKKICIYIYHTKSYFGFTNTHIDGLVVGNVKIRQVSRFTIIWNNDVHGEELPHTQLKHIMIFEGMSFQVDFRRDI